MKLRILIMILSIGLWVISSNCHAQEWASYPADDVKAAPLNTLQNNTYRYTEDAIIQKEFEVTTQWQTITFEKPLQINRKGLMGLHLAVDKRLYISTMFEQPQKAVCSKSGCATNAFCLRRLSDGKLIRPEAILIGNNGIVVKVMPAGNLYPNFDKNVITIALRKLKDNCAPPQPFPKSIKAFKAIRIRSTESFHVRYLFWNVDRYPYFN